jgi:N-acetylated-alpha-linked acidic dipeptidase
VPVSRAFRYFSLIILAAAPLFAQAPSPQTSNSGPEARGAEPQLVQKFLAVPDARLAEQHLKALTAAPHVAGSPEDKQTAEYVAQKFREAGLQTKIVEYKVWMNYPKSISVDVTAPAGVSMHGPTREHVSNDPYQDDPRVITPFNAYSPSGEVEAEVVYANYGRLEDFKKLKELGIDVRGKIVIVRYGGNFRGVKSYIAQENGAAGVIIYSDPIDDGYFKGDAYPKGAWRPATGVQRGSIFYMFKYPGDPETPGIASTPDLPESRRTPPDQAASLPKILTTPISYQDATPILANLGGPETPRPWQGALPFTYHTGPGPVKVRLNLQQDYQLRTIWDVIGMIPGTEFPNEWVVAGNHRDAWVYGAVDPNSGTAAMLEAAHGFGELLKSGWKPKRTIVLGSWDAEEEGLIGSTEWAEQNAANLANAAAYFNMDVAVSGPNFGASAVPTLKQFVRDVAKQVPSGSGKGTVYDAWQKSEADKNKNKVAAELGGSQNRPPAAKSQDVSVGDLGSGSDYTVFLQHLGIPSTDVGSSGSYGVYHSTFDNFAWFKMNADPDFRYEQQMARLFGLEVLNMAQADVLPLNYKEYGEEITQYLKDAQNKAKQAWGERAPDFQPALTAAEQITRSGEALLQAQPQNEAQKAALNRVLREAERSFLMPQGLPNRPWYKHAIYAPGEYTGYAAVVIPGVNEAIDANDLERATQQLDALVQALNRAAQTLASW